MKCQQFFQLLLESPLKANTQTNSVEYLYTQNGVREDQDADLRSKLQLILNSLNEERTQFQNMHHKNQQSMIQKINIQKDQIIQDVLESIYNLKRQNEQLKFQYRRRFKVIKNLEVKYENLIQTKNKRIVQIQSVVRYLQGKVNYVQAQLFKCRGLLKRQNHFNQSLSLSKPCRNSDRIVTRDKDVMRRADRLTPRNSLQDMTLPLGSSFVSLGKVSSSSKTITRRRSKEIRIEDRKQNQLFSSFVSSNDQNLSDKCFDFQANFQGASRIGPVCFQKNFSPSKYLALDDLNDFQQNQFPMNNKPLMRRSQQLRIPETVNQTNNKIRNQQLRIQETVNQTNNKIRNQH